MFARPRNRAVFDRRAGFSLTALRFRGGVNSAASHAHLLKEAKQALSKLAIGKPLNKVVENSRRVRGGIRRVKPEKDTPVTG